MKFLSSLRLTLFLLALIVFALIIGTLVPQGLSHYEYIQKYGLNLYQTFKSLNLINLYHSWWFITLLFLLALNTLTCSFSNFKSIKKKIGPLITHLSILIILLGSLLSVIWGERGFLSISEGETKDNFLVGERPQKLDFEVFLKDFTVEWYQPKMVKDFRSTIKIIEAGKEVLTKTIRVNSPFKYKGYTLYQASYDPDQPQWTVLEVVKDPGVPLVFIGFIFLNLGLLITFLKKGEKINAVKPI